MTIIIIIITIIYVISNVRFFNFAQDTKRKQV